MSIDVANFTINVATKKAFQTSRVIVPTEEVIMPTDILFNFFF